MKSAKGTKLQSFGFQFVKVNSDENLMLCLGSKHCDDNTDKGVAAMLFDSFPRHMNHSNDIVCYHLSILSFFNLSATSAMTMSFPKKAKAKLKATTALTKAQKDFKSRGRIHTRSRQDRTIIKNTITKVCDYNALMSFDA